MKKRLLLMLCVISCLMMVASCSLTRENKKLKESTLNKSSEQFVSQFFSYDFSSTIESYKDQMTSDQIKEYKNYAKTQKKHGNLKKIEKTEYSAASDSASVAVTVSTEKAGKLVFTMTYDKTGEMSDWKVEDYKSIGQVMGKAGLNTVMSMSIVFIVLIFIALIISCFKFTVVFQKKPEKKDNDVVEVSATPVVEENLVDDLELVAVITAAIAAAEKTESADGLVVRSILRRS